MAQLKALKGVATKNWRISRAQLAQDRYVEEMKNVTAWAADLQKEFGFITRSEALELAEQWARNQR